MPKINPHNRVLKSKMVLCGVQHKDILAHLKDKKGRQRSPRYLSARMSGEEAFTLDEALLFKRELNILDKDDFLSTFFPGEKWGNSP